MFELNYFCTLHIKFSKQQKITIIAVFTTACKKIQLQMNILLYFVNYFLKG